MTLRQPLLALCAALAILAPFAFASAQTYPERPIQLVVPFAAGGSTDLLGRKVAQQLSQALGQPVVVENKPGAGTAVAAEAVARAKPDGYTLLLATTSTLVFNPLLVPDLRYDAAKDFAGISMLAVAPMVMVVPADSPARSAADFVADAKARPGKLNFGSAGNGSSLHLAGELFKSMAGIDIVHVPYKGSQPALTALLRGEVQVFFDLIPTSRPMVDAGRLRALAVTSSVRAAVLPDVPTLSEIGFAGYDASPRFALVAPAGTPAPVVARLSRELYALLADPATRQQFAALGMELAATPPQAVGEFFATERERWGKLIKAQGIKLD